MHLLAPVCCASARHPGANLHPRRPQSTHDTLALASARALMCEQAPSLHIHAMAAATRQSDRRPWQRLICSWDVPVMCKPWVCRRHWPHLTGARPWRLLCGHSCLDPWAVSWRPCPCPLCWTQLRAWLHADAPPDFWVCCPASPLLPPMAHLLQIAGTL